MQIPIAAKPYRTKRPVLPPVLAWLGGATRSPWSIERAWVGFQVSTQRRAWPGPSQRARVGRLTCRRLVRTVRYVRRWLVKKNQKIVLAHFLRAANDLPAMEYARVARVSELPRACLHTWAHLEQQ